MPYFRHIDIQDIDAGHPVAQFAGIWTRLAEISLPVPWKSFSPMKAPGILPWIMVLEKQADGGYFYRLCGSGCEQLFGISYQGKLLGDSLPAEAYQTRLVEFGQVEETGQPLYSSTTLPIAEREHREVHRGVFGFTKSGTAIDTILVIVAPITP